MKGRVQYPSVRLVSKPRTFYLYIELNGLESKPQNNCCLYHFYCYHVCLFFRMFLSVRQSVLSSNTERR